jgi:CheY-like chemotaxis protein
VNARLIVIISADHVLQNRLILSLDELDVFVSHSCVAPPVLTDGSSSQVLIVDFDLEGSFEMLSDVRSLPRTGIIGLTDSPVVSQALRELGLQLIFGREVTPDVLLDAVRVCLDPRPSTTEPSDIQILIVDDETEIRDLVSVVLGKRGYQILKTGDGESALQLVEENPSIALVLLDIRLPGCDGMTVLTQIREKHPDMAVVMITGLLNRELAQESIRSGAFDYVVKPLDVSRIPDMVRVALSHRDYLHRAWWKPLLG